jgi:hypothetical protein
VRKPAHTAPAALTKKQNHSAAFINVTMGHLDKLDPVRIAKGHGLTVEVAQAMIDERRAREAAR